MSSLQPFTAVPPGEILEEVLREKGWSQRDLAAILARPIQAINEIIAGKKAITPETAVALSEAIHTSPHYWLELESRYRLDIFRNRKTRKEGSTVERRAKLFSKAPVNELIKRGWIKADLADLDKTERAICEFLDIDSIDEDAEGFSARKSKSTEPHTASQLSWAHRVRNVARRIRTTRYSRGRLLLLIKELPSWSNSDVEMRRIPEALADVGVRLVFVEHLTGTKIDGGALWIGSDPVIALSLRYDRVDWFWFTLLHELAHIIERESSLDQQLVGNDAMRSLLENEERANRQASEWLIPQDDLQKYVGVSKPYFSRSSILAFALKLNIHPGILVGQLQKRGEIPYSHHRTLLTRVRHLFGEAGT